MTEKFVSTLLCFTSDCVFKGFTGLDLSYFKLYSKLYIFLSHILQVIRSIINDIDAQGGQLLSWSLQDILADQDNQGQTLLHMSVDTGHYEACYMLIEKGVNVNVCRSGFVTSLHLAAATGDLNIVQLLVASGAIIDALNVMQETPLHRASTFNRTSVIEFLLQK